MRAQFPISMARITAAALLLAGCLPGDTRPSPATIHFTVEPSPAVTGGFTTVDGWHISFERLLIGVGDARLGARGDGAGPIDASECTTYANANYERLIDVAVGGRQALSDVYGLGRCGVGFSLTPVGRDTPLGVGVSAEDLAFMRRAAPIAFGMKAIRSAYVRGQATRDATTKRFAWSFPWAFSLFGCTSAGDAGFASDVLLTTGAVLDVPVVVRGEELFREGPSDDSPLRFDALAAADADGDQMITLAELSVAGAAVTDADAGVVSADGGAPSIEDSIGLALLPRMMRLGDSGPCLGSFR
jgi:hypothetical protein